MSRVSKQDAERIRAWLHDVVDKVVDGPDAEFTRVEFNIEARLANGLFVHDLRFEWTSDEPIQLERFHKNK